MSAASTSPPLPSGAAAWRARPFGGTAADLEIDFAGGQRAATVTSLLACCVSAADGRSVDVDEVWDWTLNQRLQALIAMRLASGDAAIEVQAACAQCGEAMALSLDLQAFAAAPAAPRFSWRHDDGTTLELRLPSGRDLQHWLEDGIPSHATIAAALVESVASGPAGAEHHVPESWLSALDDAFEAHDPLTALRLQTQCPACAHANTIACDLEALLLGGFARTQARLLDEVLRLASAFHWSEAEIVSLPRWRRDHYLRQLDAGAWA